MLVSHLKKFIFTKTAKTAGTSVEFYLEPYCRADPTILPVSPTAASVSDAGIVGYRGPGVGDGEWYNHMPAAAIRAALGEDTWARYFKFTIVRNPFDKTVSHFFMLWRRKIKLAEGEEESWVRLREARPERLIAEFRRWVARATPPYDGDKYLIDGRICLDDIMRYETLEQDLARVCKEIDVPFDSARLERRKSGIRRRDIEIARFYDDVTADSVAQVYAWEIEHFGYRRPA